MANLIITVISIALVAVAALMGAYYGGSAFQDGRVKSIADRWLSKEEQLASAMTLYLMDNNGDTTSLKIDGVNIFFKSLGT